MFYWKIRRKIVLILHLTAYSGFVLPDFTFQQVTSISAFTHCKNDFLDTGLKEGRNITQSDGLRTKRGII